MARRSLRLPNTLSVVLLFTVQASGLLFTLSNFELIVDLTLPLGCVLAYNSPIRGCSTNDFGNGNVCSSGCQNGIKDVESNIQASCGSANVGAASLLNQALNGQLVIALCGNRQPPPPPPPATTSISFPPPRSFSRIPLDPPPATASTTTSESTSTTSNTPTPTSTSTNDDDNNNSSTFPPSITTTSTTPRPQETNTEAQLPTTSTTPITSSSTNEPDARQTQPPGGGGSPFDFVSGKASRVSVDVSAKILALFSLILAMYMV